jgi:hypothetical protein
MAAAVGFLNDLNCETSENCEKKTSLIWIQSNHLFIDNVTFFFGDLQRKLKQIKKLKFALEQN